MSVLHVNQIGRRVRETYESFIPRDDLKNSDPEFDIKIQTRCLAAFAVQTLTACTTIDAAGSVIDGGDDNGLDAVFYSESQNCLAWISTKHSSPKFLAYCKSSGATATHPTRGLQQAYGRGPKPEESAGVRGDGN